MQIKHIKAKKLYVKGYFSEVELQELECSSA